MKTPKTQSRRSQKRVVRPRCNHSDEPNMSYVDWYRDAISRRKRGEKQTFCHECGKYVWGEYWLNATGAVSGRNRDLPPETLMPNADLVHPLPNHQPTPKHQ